MLVYENEEEMKKLEEIISKGECKELIKSNIYDEDILLVLKEKSKDEQVYKIITQHGVVIKIVKGININKKPFCMIIVEHVLSEDLRAL